MGATPRKACIAGVGETRYTKWGGTTDASEYQLCCEAITAAVADAGLDLADVDGFASFAADRNEPVVLAADLGVRELRFANLVWMPGGGGPCAAVANAAMAVEAGQAEAVVVYRALCQGQFSRLGRRLPSPVSAARPPDPFATGSYIESHQSFSIAFGVLSPVVGFAQVMRRHMHLFGTTSEQLGHVSVAFRAHANRNPRAVMGHKTMTLADHQASRMVADPYRLFDCCLESDGACAVVVTTRERALDLANRPVEILATAQGTGGSELDEPYASSGAAGVARRLWERSGVGPADVDVAQVYDHYTGFVIMTLEDYGFCTRGDGGPFVESDVLAWPHGALPTNTHGGSLSEAYVHGLNHVVEGARQMRGVSTCQVDGAELCLVTSAAGVPTSAMVLARG